MRRPQPDYRAWKASLAGGVVVAGAVWGLLEGVRRGARDVDEAVDALWLSGQRLAQNTQAAHLLTGTRAGGLALLDELQHHLDANGGPS